MNALLLVLALTASAWGGEKTFPGNPAVTVRCADTQTATCRRHSRSISTQCHDKISRRKQVGQLSELAWGVDPSELSMAQLVDLQDGEVQLGPEDILYFEDTDDIRAELAELERDKVRRYAESRQLRQKDFADWPSAGGKSPRVVYYETGKDRELDDLLLAAGKVQARLELIKSNADNPAFSTPAGEKYREDAIREWRQLVERQPDLERLLDEHGGPDLRLLVLDKIAALQHIEEYAPRSN